MKFEEGEKLYSYEVKKEAGEDVLYINYLGAPYVPSLSEYPEVMEKTVDLLIENPHISRVVFVQQKNYNYDFKETSYLLEIAQLYVYLIKQEKILSQAKLSGAYGGAFPKRYNEIFSFLFLLKRDPISSYFELKRLLIEGKILLNKLPLNYQNDQKNYLNLLEKVFEMIENTSLIRDAIPFLEGYRKGEREIYYNLFRPDVIPNFTFTRLVSGFPKDAEIIDQYEISNGEYDTSSVTILKNKNDSKLFYHLVAPENSLEEDHGFLQG